MAKIVKSADLPAQIAIVVFERLNHGKVRLGKARNGETCIYTDCEPDSLVYLEGSYYAKGCLRNKHLSSTGQYYEVEMMKSDGTPWVDIAKYCTRS